MTCSECGQRVAVGGHQQWQRRDTSTLAMGGVSAAVGAGASYEKRSPARPAQGSDVWVPLAWAAVTGILVGVIAALILDVVSGAIVGVVTVAVAWLVFLRDVRASLWAIERLTGADLDRDGVVGAPGPGPRTVKVELSESNGQRSRMRFIELPVSDEKLTAVARAVGNGANFSRPGLAGVLSQNEYAKLAKAMVSAGLLHDLPGNKRALSGAGRALLRQAGTR